jgi:hypothetical protein
MSFIVSTLAPIFLGVTGGDAVLARMAAAETIDDYRARNHVDLIAVAQIITNGLAALGSLTRSMEDELSLSMMLRLRGNAISLNRTVEQNRRVLRENRDAELVVFDTEILPEPEPPVPTANAETPREPEVFANDPAALVLVTEQTADPAPRAEPAQAASPATTRNRPESPSRDDTLAITLLREASDLTDALPTVPAAERAAAETKIEALNDRAYALLMGSRFPPRASLDDETSAWPDMTGQQPPPASFTPAAATGRHSPESP